VSFTNLALISFIVICPEVFPICPVLVTAPQHIILAFIGCISYNRCEGLPNISEYFKNGIVRRLLSQQSE